MTALSCYLYPREQITEHQDGFPHTLKGADENPGAPRQKSDLFTHISPTDLL